MVGSGRSIGAFGLGLPLQWKGSLDRGCSAQNLAPSPQALNCLLMKLWPNKSTHCLNPPPPEYIPARPQTCVLWGCSLRSLRVFFPWQSWFLFKLHPPPLFFNFYWQHRVHMRSFLTPQKWQHRCSRSEPSSHPLAPYTSGDPGPFLPHSWSPGLEDEKGWKLLPKAQWMEQSSREKPTVAAWYLNII